MSRRVNLIPMAGAGQRFVDAGYSLPKPLIDVAGQPMIARAARSLPPADLWIFVCRTGHIRSAKIDEILQRHFPPAIVIPVDHLTEGQACTCLLARNELRPDDILTIGACDNAMIWDAAAFDLAMSDPANDFLVWTFRNNPAVMQDPRMYGWVRTGTDGACAGVSVKIPISDKPMRDHAVIGSFTFRKAGLFLDACDRMIDANARVRNEFYVDQAVNFAMDLGARGRPFEVERYICWGTPRDLETHDYWRAYFQATGLD